MTMNDPSLHASSSSSVQNPLKTYTNTIDDPTKPLSKTMKPLKSALIFLLIFSSVYLCILPSDSHILNHISTHPESFTSIVISQKGLDFVKELLINQAISSIISLQLPTIEKTTKIPVIGNVHMVLSNITIQNIDVVSSYVHPGESGVAIVVSGATCNLSMNWYYKYSTWVFVPVQISDKGDASVKVLSWKRVK